MKIEKYNQRLLAVLGTVGVLFLIIALISFIIFSIADYSRFDDDIEAGILSDEEIKKLQEENKREQVISHNNPRLIDTLNQIYIIPISHKTLNEPERIDNKVLGLMSSANDFNPRYSINHYGDFNNLIIYDQKSNNTKKLFNKRVNFHDIKTEYFTDDILLLFKVAEGDTYKDGVINLLDFKSLYIYSINERKLNKIESNGMDIFSYKFLNNSKDLAIRLGIDKNNDGQYNEYNEPTILKKYNYKTGQLTNIIEEKTNNELQKTLEGS